MSLSEVATFFASCMWLHVCIAQHLGGPCMHVSKHHVPLAERVLTAGDSKPLPDSKLVMLLIFVQVCDRRL